MFRSAVRRLQGNRAVRQRRTDLHDNSAIARHHSPQRRHCAVHRSKVSHFCRALELFRSDFPKRRKHRGHRVVDPSIDKPKFRFELSRGVLDLIRIRYVSRNGERVPSERLDFLARCVETFGPARDQTYICAALRKCVSRRAAYSRRCARDYNVFSGSLFGSVIIFLRRFGIHFISPVKSWSEYLSSSPQNARLATTGSAASPHELSRAGLEFHSRLFHFPCGKNGSSTPPRQPADFPK